MSTAPGAWQLDGAALREWSRVDNARSVAHLLLEPALVAGAIMLCEAWWHPALYVATVVWLGARQHALLVLMHDAAHGRLLSARRWNDAAGELLAWPLGITMHGFRRSHLAHHHFLGTARDPDLVYWQDSPDYRFPMGGGGLARVLAAYAAGLRTMAQLRVIAGYLLTPRSRAAHRQNASDRPGVQRLRVAFYLAAAVLVWYRGAWREVAIYWVVPAFTWLAVILYFRSAAEHYALDGSTAPLRSTRTLVLGGVARCLVAPKSIGLHLEHHLYPSVPFHRLPRLHAQLASHPEYRAGAHITTGLLGAFRELAAGTARRP